MMAAQRAPGDTTNVRKKRLDLSALGFDHRVTELFGPGRFLEVAGANGLNTGDALRLTCADSHGGLPSDLNDPTKRRKVMAALEENRPFHVVGLPMCLVLTACGPELSEDGQGEG